MSLSPTEQFEAVKREVTTAIKELFPVVNGSDSLHVENVEVSDNKDPEDLRSQVKATEDGDSWTVPVHADVVVTKNGKETGRKRMKILDLPRTTARGGYIHGGSEYQIQNLFTRKAGVYHRIRDSGDVVADFNLANKSQFAGERLKLSYDPETTQVSVLRGTSALPAYDALSALGVPDAEMQRAWGQAIFDVNKAKSRPEISKKRLARWLGVPVDSAIQTLRDTLGKTELYPETTARTLGIEAKKVTPEVLLRSASKLIHIVQGKEEADNQEAMEFQRIAGAPELFADQLRKSRTAITRKVAASLGKETKGGLRGKLPVDVLQRPLDSFFTTSLANQSEQTNPLEIMAGSRRTTIMGEHGGIRSEHVVSDEAKLIDPSHLGFLDPIHTPEGPRLGVTLSIPLGAKKVGRDLRTTLLNAKTGKLESVSSTELGGKVIAFPDGYDLKGAKAKPRSAKVQAQRNGEMVSVDPKSVHYILPSARGMFGVTTNLVPFLGSDQGNRAMTASRQAEQAVPLKYREKPLVQVLTDGKATFEEVLGHAEAKHAPVDGEVVQVKSDAVVLKDSKGSRHEVQFHRNYSGKAATLFDSEVRVKAGDKVRKGQLLADTTFTKDGTLALGTNLRTGYIPLAGYNFEDGIVISESAAQKLTSEHLHKPETALGKGSILGRRAFVQNYPALFNANQLKNIKDDGLIEVGSKVQPGDPLVLAVHDPTDGGFKRARKRASNARRYVSGAVTWDSNVTGVVTAVQRVQDKGQERLVVHVRTEEPAQVGDKLVGRHGNKGVITRIIADAEMPYVVEGKEKKPLDIALNPMGIPGRINLGQVLETAAGKIAAKTGKTYKVENFSPDIKDYTDHVSKELKAAGFDPDGKEVLYDPSTGKPFGQQALVGQQYIYKLRHQVEKKVAARAGSGSGRTSSGASMAPYDVNKAPSSGAPHGGQSMGELGTYALLAHGARENIREMLAYKGEKNTALWDALREGTPLPPPQTPFAYTKFLGLLGAVRVDVKREGNSLQLVPYTEEQVRKLAPKALPEPGLVLKSTTADPQRGGLFDPEITGGLDGKKWSRFDLPEPMPNPVFEEAIKKLLAINDKEFTGLVDGSVAYKGVRGGKAIEAKLKEIDVKKELAAAKASLSTAKGEKRDRIYKKFRILKALDEANLDPTVYMMKSVPVLPPVFRPIVTQPDGQLMVNDVNFLYRDLAYTTDGLKKVIDGGGDYVSLQPLRAGAYAGLQALAGMGGAISKGGRSGTDRDYRGILDAITGKTRHEGGDVTGEAKSGFFRKGLLRRRQDYSARSTITVEPGQALDELGIPEKIAWTLYQPFAERELVRRGMRPLDATEEYMKRTPQARSALESAMSQRPVLFKRDPALHKFNVMAFKPRLVRGSAIEIHPLATGGFNADFDGDAMSLYLPVSDAAAREAVKMFPSNNLFSPTTGAVMHTPGHEALLGLYLLTKPGRKTDQKFKTESEAKQALQAGKIKVDDVIRVGGHETTLGKLKVEALLPPELRETGKKRVADMRVIDKGTSRDLLSSIAKNHPDAYGRIAHDLMATGTDHSYREGFSVGLNDFRVVEKETRDKIVRAATRAAEAVAKSPLSKEQKQEKTIKIFMAASDKIDAAAEAHLARNPTNIHRMVVSGSRGDPEQLKQIISTPALVKDSKDQVVPFLIPKSYSEGMDTASYWTTLSGARKGTLQKTQGVAMPGYMTKLMINSTMDQLVTEEDCGAREGVTLPVDSGDVLDRYLSKDTRLGKNRYRAGSIVTPQLISAAKKAGKSVLDVRSPLRCRAEHGICKHCLGLSESGRPYDIGTNIGVIASQALGEPSTQLSLNVFHTGGIAKGRTSASMGTFKRLEELLTLRTDLPGAAPLAPRGGKVSKIETAPQGGHFVHIGDTKEWVPPGHELLVHKGSDVLRGAPLSSGVQNPTEVLKLRGLPQMQDYVTDQIASVLRNTAKVKRKNVEVVVKAMTDVTQVEDPGGHPDWVPGDIRPITKVEAWNRQARAKGVAPVKHEPQVKGVKLLPKSLQEDWLARLNFEDLTRSLTQGFREGWKSDLHGFHPVPGMAAASEFGKGKHKVQDWKGQY